METIAAFSESSPLAAALVASFIGGFLATSLGALPALFVARLSAGANNSLLAFAGGVMLAATVFSLLLPGLHLAEPMFGNRLRASAAVVAAMIVGGAFMMVINRLLPHEHFWKGREGPSSKRIARVWLFVFAIAVHNFPEGLSMGVGAASGDAKIGLGVMMAIGLQNLPEGLAVAMSLAGLGYSRARSIGIAALTGFVEVFGGLVGAGLVTLSTALLPAALAFAAGTMLFVIIDEVIPETHRAGLGDSATTALFIGFGLMFFLDVAFV